MKKTNEKVEAAKQAVFALPGVKKVEHGKVPENIGDDDSITLQDQFTIHCYIKPGKHDETSVKSALARSGFTNCQVRYEYDKGLTDENGNKIHWDPPV